MNSPPPQAALAPRKAGPFAALLCVACLTFCSLQLQAQGLATRVVADPAAPGTQQATVLNAGNGVVQVNIQTPSAAGVSRNTFSQFDVGGQGAILNNSRSNLQTQLGGWVQGNPWLAGGSARVIVNEVNASRPSRLQGYVEVAGPRAEVVIANPAGIAVAGGGFINAAGVTLATGTPRFSGGQLEGYSVQGGTLRIEATGLDTRGADATVLLGRSLQLDGGIWAQQLQVVLGANEVASTGLGAGAALRATPLAGTGPAPAYAFYASQLGGMYAGSIVLRGTEAGLGVRNAGQVIAGTGPLVLSHEGWLSNTGTLRADRGEVSVQVGGRLEQGGAVYADQGLQLVSAGDQVHTGLAGARGDLRIEARGPGARVQADAGAVWAAGLQPEGRLVGQQALRVQAAGAVQAAGQALASGELALEGARLDLAGARLQAKDIHLGATAGDLDATGARILATQALQVQAAQALVTEGATLQADALTAQARDLRNAGGALVQTGAQEQLIALQGDLDNADGRIASAGALRLQAQGIRSSGLLSAAGDLTVDADTFQGSGAHAVVAGLAADGSLGGPGSLRISTRGALQSAGQLLAADDVRLEGASLDLGRGQVASARGDVDLNATGGDLLTREAQVNASGQLRVTALAPGQTLDNTGGALSGQSVQVRAGQLRNAGGQIVAAQSADLSVASLSGAGLLVSQGDLALHLQGDHTLTGTLQAGGSLLLETTGRLSNPVRVQAGTRLEVRAQDLDNQDSGELLAGQATQLRVAGTFTNRGLVDGADTRVEAQAVDNLGTGRIFGDRLAIAAADLSNREETRQGQTRAATLAGRERVDLGMQRLSNREGALVFSGGDLAIGGALDASGRATGSAQAVDNSSASIEAAQDLRIAAATIRNTNAHFATEIRQVSQGPFTQFQHLPGDTTSAGDNSTRFAPDQVRIFDCEALCMQTDAGTSDAFVRYDVQRSVSESVVTRSAPARILAGGSIRVAADALLNDKSQIVAGGALEATGTRVDNVEGQGLRITEDAGTATAYSRRRRNGRDSFNTDSAAYAPAPLQQSIALPVTRYEAHAAGASVGAMPAATSLAAGPSPAGSQAPVVVATAAGDVRSLPPGTRLPTASLFRTQPESGARYLVETDPRFTQYRTWLGSDYMLAALGIDPATTGKRMGDAFYEQRLIREQVLALTGQRFLGNFSSDDQQYQALMDAGLTWARQWNLRPGLALSAEQVAQLTSDIVWLVTQEVSLPDGTRQSVLVPQVYVRAQAGDLDGTGALLAGREVRLTLAGDAVNGGTIAGRHLVRINAENIRNLGGTVSADALAMQARQDLDNTGGRLQAQSALVLDAGRDLRVTTTTTASTRVAGGNHFAQTGIDRVAGLYVSGPAGVLLATAGRDLSLTGAEVANTGGGATQLQAGRDVNLAAVSTGSSQDIAWTDKNYLRQSASREVGAQVSGAGAVTIQAGRDVHARAADVKAGAALSVAAARDVAITAGVETQSLDVASEHRSSGLTSSRTLSIRETGSSQTAIASGFEGQSVALSAGKDLRLTGSNVLADGDIDLHADGAVIVEAARETRSQSSRRQETRSGLMSGGGVSLMLGTQSQTLAQEGESATAAASTVGSIGGHVRISAGTRYQQTGSDIATPRGDIAITAQAITLEEARESERRGFEQTYRQSGVTLALTSPVISTAQAVEQQATAASRTRSGRMQALAAANAVMAVAEGVAQVQGALARGDATAGLGISLSVGSSSSRSTDQTRTDSSRGSTVRAGGHISLRANGAGQDSNLIVQGSDIKAEGVTRLQADNRVDLLAARNSSEESSSQSSRSASVGVSVGVGARGASAGVTLSASGAKGQGAGQSTSYSNTHVEGGQQVVIESGGDTRLQGATVTGRQLSARIGGNLVIESLQDSSRYRESGHSASASVTVGPSSGASVTLGRTRIDSDFTSVGEQSALRAGDGGFQVAVQGHTTLTGGQVTSTEQAVQQGVNRFDSAGGTTLNDLHNAARYSAQSVSVGVSGGAPAPGASVSAGLSGMGVGSDSGSAQSTSTAAISGVAGDVAARTGDKSASLSPLFNRDQVRAEITAQTAITQEFGKQASRVVGDYAAARLEEATRNGDTAGIEAWRDGGAARVALHVAVGGLTGGVQGAVGAGAASAAAPALDQLQGQLQEALEQAGLGAQVSQGFARLVAGGTAAVLGATASGGSPAGAAAAFNSDMNNRQLHPSEVQLARDLAGRSGGKYTQAQIEEQMRLMGNAATGEQPNSTTVLTTTDAIVGSVQVDPRMPRTAQGSVVVEVPGSPNAELQTWIVKNTPEGGGYIPGQSPYVPSNPALAPPVLTTRAIDAPTASVSNNDLAGKSGVGVQQNPPLDEQAREAIAAGASGVSRVAGVTSSIATSVVATVPQSRPIFGPLGVGAAVVGLGADAVGHAVMPDLGQAAVDGVGLWVTERVNRRFPGFALATNESVEGIKNSMSVKSLQRELNVIFGIQK